ncbi:hypothetical protein CG724_11535 [Streptomyces sp. CB02120-2]|nr:hypothetical protein CG724_11535 [Streptomyces sp. CB02120-2]
MAIRPLRSHAVVAGAWRHLAGIVGQHDYGVVVLTRAGPPAEGAVLAGQSPESWGTLRTVHAVDHAFTLPAI